MKRILIEIEDDVEARLKRVGPPRSRRRSEFVEAAIRKALWEVEEQATAEAYRRQPDSPDEACYDPRTWEPPGRPRRGRGGG